MKGNKVVTSFSPEQFVLFLLFSVQSRSAASNQMIGKGVFEALTDKDKDEINCLLTHHHFPPTEAKFACVFAKATIMELLTLARIIGG